MSKISLCIEPLFPGMDFYDKIKAAGDLGFKAVEFWSPDDKDPAKVAQSAAAAGVTVAGCCINNVRTIGMNLAKEVVVPNVRSTFAAAREMGVTTLIALTSDLEGRGDTQKLAIIENLKRLADDLEKEGITLVLEALNSLVDHKGYYLDSSSVGFEIVKAVGSSNVKLLYDIYHMQIMEGNIISNITRNIDLIGHFHSASVPGRNEPFLGESNYEVIIKRIKAAGYDRYFGLEYFPTYDSAQSAKDVLAYIEKCFA